MNKKKIAGIIVLCIMIFVLGFCTNIFIGNEKGDIRIVYSLDKRENDKEIITQIDQAKSYVYFAVYYFTKENIAGALIRARNRGLNVVGIVDREGAQKGANASIVKLLTSAGIPVYTQKHLDGIMHMKVVVTDRGYASGSYNWTDAATESNDEVLEIGNDDTIRKKYLDIVKKVIEKNKDNRKEGKVQSIGFAEAINHIGEYAEVGGTIYKVFRSNSGTVFFDFCKSSKDCPFSAVMFAEEAKKITNLKDYEGEIVVSGIIRSYKGKAEIVIEGKDQLMKVKAR